MLQELKFNTVYNKEGVDFLSGVVFNSYKLSSLHENSVIKLEDIYSYTSKFIPWLFCIYRGLDAHREDVIKITETAPKQDVLIYLDLLKEDVIRILEMNNIFFSYTEQGKIILRNQPLNNSW